MNLECKTYRCNKELYHRHHLFTVGREVSAVSPGDGKVRFGYRDWLDLPTWWADSPSYSGMLSEQEFSSHFDPV